jgi:hypothetical protein
LNGMADSITDRHARGFGNVVSCQFPHPG